jgi:phosphonate transport system permease protein
VVSDGPVEGVAAHGAGWLAQRIYGVMPQATPDLIGQWAYSVDSNVRSATILGYVAAGGIGYDWTNAIRVMDYDRILMITLAVYLVVAAFDRLSDQLRRRII